MATISIDKSELEYFKSCRDKLRDIADLFDKDEERLAKDEEKLKEIKKIMKGESSFRESEK